MVSEDLIRRQPAEARAINRILLAKIAELEARLRDAQLQAFDRLGHLQEDDLRFRTNPIPQLGRHPCHAQGVAEIADFWKTSSTRHATGARTVTRHWMDVVVKLAAETKTSHSSMPGARDVSLGSGISVKVASVSIKTPATETAFSRAMRTTFVGSMIPASTRSTY